MTDIAFPSSGDPDRDREIAEEFLRHDRLIAEGMCPNGCGPMAEDDPQNQTCPVCGFHHWQNVPRD